MKGPLSYARTSKSLTASRGSSPGWSPGAAPPARTSALETAAASTRPHGSKATDGASAPPPPRSTPAQLGERRSQIRTCEVGSRLSEGRCGKTGCWGVRTVWSSEADAKKSSFGLCSSATTRPVCPTNERRYLGDGEV